MSGINCGEATIRLLEAYGVDTVFGIPGVHTLEFYRGLAASSIRHVQPRNEQGAGFMADGYARACGKPGVCLVISGPGVTNALTGLGQAYADSIPLLLLSSDAASASLGKGWGCLHEVPSLTEVTAPLTTFSETVRHPDEVPELLAKAFAVFAGARPRPVHIAIPIDVLAQPVSADWAPRTPPAPAPADRVRIAAAAAALRKARRPLLCIGGGAVNAAPYLQQIAQRLGAAVVCSAAGKGIVPDSSPLSLGARLMWPQVQDYLSQADAILAIGTELAETDSYIERLPLTGNLIRVDIDARKINDLYPAVIGIVADAGTTAAALLEALGKDQQPRTGTEREVAALKKSIDAALSAKERQHCRLLEVLREVLPADSIVMGDICQPVYSGVFAFEVDQPRLWHYPGGYCTLGCALPDAIGAKLALPERPVIALAGDGGFMFTVQELMTAVELQLPIPIVLWNNRGYQQIRDGMHERGIKPVGVDGINPDFIRLAQACGCNALRCSRADILAQAVTDALTTTGPTLIEIREDDAWLLD